MEHLMLIVVLTALSLILLVYTLRPWIIYLGEEAGKMGTLMTHLGVDSDIDAIWFAHAWGRRVTNRDDWITIIKRQLNHNFAEDSKKEMERIEDCILASGVRMTPAYYNYVDSCTAEIALARESAMCYLRNRDLFEICTRCYDNIHHH